MKIAIIGSGIAGNVVAYRLCRDHDVTVFEANDYVGGHTNTHDIDINGTQYAVDTGFIVFNEKTYPNFIALLDELGVASQKSDMSFSVKCEKTGLEYNGTSVNSLFAQRRNLFRPSFYRMIADILRFNREAMQLLQTPDDNKTLDHYLQEGGYCKEFIEHYLIPMGAAIWSTDPLQMYSFPARYFIQFFANHGLLNVTNRPQWYMIKNGSKSYLEPLIKSHRDRIRLNTPVEQIKRYADHVEVKAAGCEAERFDQVFIAAHSNQALSMLADASTSEREILGAIAYQPNEAVLHTDSSVLPRKRLAWAAWNYHILPKSPSRAAVTYNMNILQGIKAPVEFCVTLNNTSAIEPSKIIKRIRYDHPVYTPESVAAQKRQAEINGINRTYFCGAYWRYGFHEDGVVSALTALQHFEERYDDS